MGRDRRPRRSRGRGRWRARDGEPPIRRIAAHAGTITDLAGRPQKVNRAAPNAPSVVYDAVVVLGGASAAVLAESGLAIHFVNEAYRHGKPLAAVGNGALLLDVCSFGEANAKEGLVIGDDAEAVRDLITALLQHRFPRRSIARVPA